MIADLVSIIIPCYNGEEYLAKTLDSILNQTYKKLEIFFVNDGSIDKTEKIALEYKEKFEKNDIKFNYIYQENQGQAAAINNVLKLINGNFLTWPDSDDLLTPNSIEKRVNFLKENKDYGFVRNAVEIREFKTERKISEFRLYTDINENIFEDLIYCNNVFFSPVSYMVNTRFFKLVNPICIGLEILSPKLLKYDILLVSTFVSNISNIKIITVIIVPSIPICLFSPITNLSPYFTLYHEP